MDTRFRISFLLTYRLTVKLFTLFVESGYSMLSAFWSRAWAFCPSWSFQDRPRVSTWNDQLYTGYTELRSCIESHHRPFCWVIALLRTLHRLIVEQLTCFTATMLDWFTHLLWKSSVTQTVSNSCLHLVCVKQLGIKQHTSTSWIRTPNIWIITCRHQAIVRVKPHLT